MIDGEMNSRVDVTVTETLNTFSVWANFLNRDRDNVLPACQVGCNDVTDREETFGERQSLTENPAISFHHVEQIPLCVPMGS